MIKKIIYISLIWMVFHGASLHAASLLVEAESFTEKGGWVVDQQFMDLMGSPYLLAHGLGSPVENASTNVQLPEWHILYFCTHLQLDVSMAGG